MRPTPRHPTTPATSGPAARPRRKGRFAVEGMKFIEIDLSDDQVARSWDALDEEHKIAEQAADRCARPDERRDVGLRIDPATASVFFLRTQSRDPYRDNPDLPDELRQISCEYFAVDPVERVAVHFGDLPAATREALAEKRHAADAAGRRRVHRLIWGD